LVPAIEHPLARLLLLLLIRGVFRASLLSLRESVLNAQRQPHDQGENQPEGHSREKHRSTASEATRMDQCWIVTDAGRRIKTFCLEEPERRKRPPAKKGDTSRGTRAA